MDVYSVTRANLTKVDDTIGLDYENVLWSNDLIRTIKASYSQASAQWERAIPREHVS
jgi:hypothetical protein